MRLDKFLKVSRLIKRRSVASETADANRILVNGQSAKPAKQLKPNDTITILGHKRSITVKVLLIPEGNIAPQLAPTLYEIIEEKTL